MHQFYTAGYKLFQQVVFLQTTKVGWVSEALCPINVNNRKTNCIDIDIDIEVVEIEME